MKINQFLILVIFVFTCLPLFAQLNGLYTVNPAASASATNYKDVLSVVQDLDSGKRSDGYKANGPGINGPVTVQISDGLYYTHLRLSSISGTSAANTIRFTSKSKDSSKVVLADSTFGYVLYLENIGYTTFENLTFKETGGRSLEVIIMGQNLGHITLTHSQVIGHNQTWHFSQYGPNDFSDGALIYLNEVELYANGQYIKDSLIHISYNLIRGGFNGISSNIDTGYGSTIGRVSISNNIIDSFQENGIEASGDSVSIVGNEIHNSFDKRGIGIRGDTSVAIYLVNARHANVFKNRIYMPNGSGVEESLSYNIQIANNFISAGGHGVGVSLYGGDEISFIYNNVLMLDGDTAPCVNRGFTIAWQNVALTKYYSVVITNNNFVNSAGGIVVAGVPYYGSIFNSYPTYCDYNNYYTTTPSKAFNDFVIVKACLSYLSLADCSKLTGFDSHSLFLDPGYKSESDLHISNQKLFGKGNPNTAYYTNYISTDIDNYKRSATAPTIGADEIPDTIPHVVCRIGTPGLNTPNVVCLG